MNGARDAPGNVGAGGAGAGTEGTAVDPVGTVGLGAVGQFMPVGQAGVTVLPLCGAGLPEGSGGRTLDSDPGLLLPEPGRGISGTVEGFGTSDPVPKPPGPGDGVTPELLPAATPPLAAKTDPGTPNASAKAVAMRLRFMIISHAFAAFGRETRGGPGSFPRQFLTDAL